MHLISVTALVAALALEAEAYIKITGTGGWNTVSGVRPDRLEINGMAAAGGPAWDLYIQCFAQVQSRPLSQIDSFYQIAGIHGRPYIGWDGVGSAPGSHAGGFCPHSSILFPTWHRPYLSLLEQTIWQCAQTLAATYPSATRSSYVSAASTLRIPYWDWVKTAALPPITTQSTITINKPTGQATINNPLYSFKFPSRPSTSDFPNQSQAPQKYLETVRQPDSNGKSNFAAVNSQLAQNAAYLHDTTYMILTRDENYAEFASNGFPGTIQGYGSLENPHGVVHNLVGGSGGHMTYLDYSAFDPIFWLHHCNVDRLIAIWQALHPNSFTINQVDNSGTFSITAGTTETATTPLGPFHRDNTTTTIWNSNQARSTRDFGYTYPEIKSPWSVSAAQLTTNVRAAIRSLYDPNGALGRRSRVAAPSQLNSRDTPPLDPSSAIIKNGTYTQWALNLRVNKFELPASFNIFIFMGDAGTNPASWPLGKKLVASYPVLRPAGAAPTDNLPIYATIPLTRALLEASDSGELQNLQAVGSDGASPYLKKNLNWKLADLNGQEIKISDVSSLRFFVVGQEVTPPQGPSDFPTYGKAKAYRDILKGKPGALGDNEALGVGTQ